MNRETKYKIIDDEFVKLKWIGRMFCNMKFEKYINWRISFMEEDGGAYLRFPDKGFYEGKTPKEAIDAAWKYCCVEDRVLKTLAYRDLNYKDETDEQLGIEVAE